MDMKVIKRDGRLVDFNIRNIEHALVKAFNAVEGVTENTDEVTYRNYEIIQVINDVYKAIKNEKRITVEKIQDAVETALINNKNIDVAKAYIKYRYEHAKIRETKNAMIDAEKQIESYIGPIKDWRVKENSTVDLSIGGLILSNSGVITANYWLSHVYDDEIANAHRNADIHIHDLSMLCGYCFTGDTRVKTLNGENYTFKEMVDNNINEFWVYAYDIKNEKVVPAKAINPRITRRSNRLIKITLATKETIMCTPDHLFLNRQGEYIKAKDLKPNMSLMPLYVADSGKYTTINKKWYGGEKGYVHRWVMENILGRKLTNDEVVHHIDGKKHNNDPENLQVMKDSEHRSMEINSTMNTSLWKTKNKIRLNLYNKSKEKRNQISELAKNRMRDTRGKFTSFQYDIFEDPKMVAYNHSVRKIENIILDNDIDLYDLTVPGYENFALDSDIFVHNCAGWSLKQLIQEGLGGVSGKITSKPASHLSTLCNQMVNFLGILQNEWAGAQAFSSFDTYLAPFVKVDHLSYKETKQCIQSFIYGVNTPSRWGCVDSETELLTVSGFKKYNEVHEGEQIFTWNNGALELNPIRKVIIKPYKGKLHSYIGRGYNQTVTPTHRMLVKKHNTDDYIIKHSEDVFSSKTPYALPAMFKEDHLQKSPLTDEEIQMAAIVYSDGSVDIRNDKVHKITIFKSSTRYGNDLIKELSDELGLEVHCAIKSGEFGSDVNTYTFYGESARKLGNLIGNTKKEIDDKFTNMNMEQSWIFLYTWAHFDGNAKKMKLQYDNENIANSLQLISLRSGHISYLKKSHKANYVKIHMSESLYPSVREEIEYDDIVWCPNVENGTAVFRKDGCVFISGQTQAPFTNITLDWTVPNDLKNLPAIVGGENQDFTYGDCKNEMDMVNKAFIEIMIEGDANGRGFEYPIPTYSITKDFDWSDTENNKMLFEMTAKYGTPYFSNYINSDMEPSDVRSMAILGTQELIYRNNGIITKNEVRQIIKNWNSFSENNKPEYEMLMNGKFVPVVDMFKVPYDKYDNYVTFKLKNGITQSFSWQHKCPVIRNGKYEEIESQDVKIGDKFLIAKKAMPGPNIGTYTSGLIIGYYLAEGWKTHNREINFAININREDIVKTICTFFEDLGARVRIDKQDDHNIYKIFVYGENALGFVETFIKGNYSTTKRLRSHILNTSIKFRQGVYDGYLNTDGSQKNNVFVHTTNKKLCMDLQMIAATLGIVTKYSIDKNNTRYFKEDKNDFEKFTSYKLDIVNNLKEYNKDYYEVEISDISYPKSNTDTVYNFTVNTKDHLYELPNGIITHQCCRLRLDLRELRKKAGGFFGSGESTGSVGVVTINLPRIAYLSINERTFYKRLDYMMDIAAKSLNMKRKVITKLLDDGMYPYTKKYLGTFENHFSTIGLVGMNEATLNAKWIQKDLTHDEAQQFAKDVLNHMRDRLSDYQEKYGALFNLEATPAESTSYRLAKHDVEKYPDIITAAKPGCTPYYTNSSHLPVGYTDDIFKALKIQDDLQVLYTSGTVFHAFLGSRLNDWHQAMTLVRSIATNFKLPYYTLSPTYSVCPEHGYISGETFTCPECGKETEVYSRITGYYRPLKNWNDGKAQEFKDRTEYNVQNTSMKPNNDSDDPETDFSKLKLDNYDSKPMLFTVKSCPNCKIAELALSKMNIEYTKIQSEDNPELCKKLNIKQAPTLIINDSKYGIMPIVNVSNIINYTKTITK